ncbi:hypothetical protein [Pectobacterium carotovorum]|uniref:Uncharacterized protein n=1 Tax=Pectobacterium carotovorum TaxID=554 RepID=A0A419AXW6_PECCA|nr:hypothetical protein [Pectobacterium carotovorum]RJL52536.1 hypothetical protein D5071_07685 [Pectobacterium carotovorum]
MTSDKDEIYRLVSELLHGIQHGDPVALVSFGVSPAIYEEMIEEWDRNTITGLCSTHRSSIPVMI